MVNAVLSIFLCWPPLAAPGDAASPSGGAGSEMQLQTDLAAANAEISRLRQEISRVAGSPAEPGLWLQLAKVLRVRARLQIDLRAEAGDEHWYDDPEGRRSMEEALEALQHFFGTGVFSLRPPALLERIQILRELGRFDLMLSTIAELAEENPRSEEAGSGLLILADYHFDRENFTEAARQYRKIISGAFSAEVSNYARYRLAWVRVNEAATDGQKTWAEALELFGQVARSRKEMPDVVQKRPRIDLRRQALIDMALCFPRARPNGDALKFFEGFGMDREETLAILPRLAQRYYMEERFAAAGAIYRKLLSLNPPAQDAEDYRARLEDIEHLPVK